MNSVKYNTESIKISNSLNLFFSDFCKRHNSYLPILNDYIKKEIHLNGVQFVGGFLTGSDNDWERHKHVAVAIELVMLWAYKTNRILDEKQGVWDSKQNVKLNLLQQGIILSCIIDLLEEYREISKLSNAIISEWILSTIKDMSLGFSLEAQELSSYTKEVDLIIENWEAKYTKRNNLFNRVYDLAPLMGYAISSNKFDIIKDYYENFNNKYKFSNVGQIINDLGDFGDEVDTNVKSYQDLFSDIRNGVITMPVYELIDNKIIRKALKSKSVSRGKIWRWRVRRLIKSQKIDEKVITLTNKSYLLHKDFYNKYVDNLDPLLMKSYSMLTNNKYFNQEVIKQSQLGPRSKVILCDKNGKELGVYDKILAHKEGKLHKAFSVFIYNKKGELLIQQRAENKYHSGGLWANSCCSHYVSGENILETIQNRLIEELGFSCDIKNRFSFVYDLDVSGGMREHEFDTIFEGKYNGSIKLNPEEVQNYRWISIENLKHEIRQKPDKFAPWFKKILERAGIVTGSSLAQ